MTRHYSPYDTTQTERFRDRAHTYQGQDGPGYGTAGFDHSAGTYGGYTSDAPYDADYDDYADDDIEFYEESIDRRWIWVAGVAGAILLVAVICTVVILGGGDSGSVSATVAAPTQTSQPATTTPPQDATSKPVRPAPPSLSPETVTTVTPSPSATAAPAPVAPPVEAAPPAPAANTVTYHVTGNRQLIDLVTIVYTDAQGALQTDINVALPWTKTVTLNPGVQLKSVTGTSVAGQLNCSITDASGAVIVQQTNNSMITTCTQ
ncbi:hypothetical protein [Mycolicibacterium sp.]|uniref:hypothetical protein n=1 Tax=Mycolicibacterium sp. TaxID=2320850 RepID=UPI0037C82619